MPQIRLLAIFLCFAITSEYWTGYVCALKGDPAELEECRSKNKGKWCTCRRLADHVKPLIGRKLGMFLPKVSDS